MAARRKDERAAAAKAIADAVKAHKGTDGLVKLYPTEPVGDNTVPGVPALPLDVEPAEAERLLAYRPAAFTLYESGNPPKEHGPLDEADFEQAWSTGTHSDAASVDATVSVEAIQSDVAPVGESTEV